ncbi:MAG: DegT/DnrJ/EryC1/StrS family aminotransferase [Bacteroidetes bacterium]|nr:DegT/DnrJ/EryC1/StrS family aminotransferase [Bacteroidota bacterium]
MIEYENLFLSNREFTEELQQSFEQTLKSGWFILGNKVKEFEKEFALYCGSRHCVGVASGLDALFLSLKACSFKPGDEVIVPSNTYIATILAVLNAGLKPVMAEPDIRTYNIDPEKIREQITAKTVAIMPVHLYGKLCDMESIMEIARENNLVVIEDCAQAHGAAYKGKRAGTFGTFGAFSYYPTKNLGALGDAGSITTDDETLLTNLHRLRNYGSDVKYYNEIIGYNSRLDEIQAAFLSVKLKKLDRINEHKRKLAKLYSENLKDDFIKPHHDENYYDVFHIYAIRHEKRDELKKYLLDNGIKTDIHYPVAPHQQHAMKEIFKGIPCPLSEQLHASILSLPISYFHTEEDVNRVIAVMNKFELH